MDAIRDILMVVQAISLIGIILVVIIGFFIPLKLRILQLIFFAALILCQAIMPIVGIFKESFIYIILHWLLIIK